MIKLVNGVIDVGEVLASVSDPAAGGIDIFVGTTRNQSNGKEVLSLEYQAYEPMALKMMNGIAEEMSRRWETVRVAIVHRIGAVPIGEASVVIAAAAVHRKEAFEACRFAIDALKRNVPIWKKEIFADGGIWIGTQEE
jgi:molybdopterin synthase catalytic subunit